MKANMKAYMRADMKTCMKVYMKTYMKANVKTYIRADVDSTRYDMVSQCAAVSMRTLTIVFDRQHNCPCDQADLSRVQAMSFSVHFIKNVGLLDMHREANQMNFGTPVCHVSSTGRMVLQTAPDRYGSSQLRLELKGLSCYCLLHNSYCNKTQKATHAFS